MCDGHGLKTNTGFGWRWGCLCCVSCVLTFVLYMVNVYCCVKYYINEYRTFPLLAVIFYRKYVEPFSFESCTVHNVLRHSITLCSVVHEEVDSMGRG